MWAAVLAFVKLSAGERALAERLALTEAKNIEPAFQRILELTTLAKHLVDRAKREALQEGLKAVDEVKDTNDRFWAFESLAHHLDRKRKHRVLSEALKIVPNLVDMWDSSGNDWKRANAIAKIAPLLSEELVECALEIANTFSNAWARSEAKIALLSQLPEDGREAVVEDLLAFVKRCLQTGRDQAKGVNAASGETRGRHRSLRILDGSGPNLGNPYWCVCTCFVN